MALWEHCGLRVSYNDPDRDIALWRASPNAEIFLGESMYEESIAAADRALEIDPNHASAYVAKGRSQFQLERYTESEGSLRRFLELAPPDQPRQIAENLYVLGEALRIQGRIDEAVEVYTRSLELQPQAGYVQRRLDEIRGGP